MTASTDKKAGLAAAAIAWDVSAESLDQIVRRIHDGVPVDQLEKRARDYLSHVENLFPYAAHWNFSSVLEVGSGVGFILEEVELRTRHIGQRRIVGLDISESMISKAKERLAENMHYKAGTISFCLYDGVVIPSTLTGFDFIYSFATLQHIPKPFVYNLFYEIKKILKPSGYAILHFAPFSMLAGQETNLPWRSEIDQQIGRPAVSHWHHYYSREELEAVMRITGFKHVDIADGYYVCVGLEGDARQRQKRYFFGRNSLSSLIAGAMRRLRTKRNIHQFEW